MLNETFKTQAHTTEDGTLNLSVIVGLPDADVAVVVQVKALGPGRDLDENGWPKNFFERVAGSMPDLERAPQGQFEERLSLE
jgi:hypothetical protein